jgi:hypothetical protein
MADNDHSVNQEILKAFSKYKDVIWGIDRDIQYWQSFLKWSIKEYQEKNKDSRLLFETGFFAYDIDYDTQGGLLKSRSETFEILSSDLENHRQDFMNWVMNFSIIKAYNGLELFFLQVINVVYFKETKNPIENKRTNDKIQKGIKDFLILEGIEYDTKNNRHILEFFKAHSGNYTSFLKKYVRVDLKTDWETFFELLSVLRNIIAHNGMMISIDVHNEIKSKSKDIFQKHFEVISDNKGTKHLRPKETSFNDFIQIINDFVLNSVKHIMNQADLSFLDMN